MPDSAIPFVLPGHIVRKIWSQEECILFLFAASAAEFAAHQTVDWLYFTGKIPEDPIGRMFSTLEYARQIVFSSEEVAVNTIGRIRQIHSKVESARRQRIPDWAYRDVLLMLIDYSVRAYESLYHTLCYSDKQDILEVFLRIGRHLEIPNLPQDYIQFESMRQKELNSHLVRSELTVDLYMQYRKHLGPIRYYLLLLLQNKLCHPVVRQKLNFRYSRSVSMLWKVYQLIRCLPGYAAAKFWLVPTPYRSILKQLKSPQLPASKVDKEKFRRCPVSQKNVHY